MDVLPRKVGSLRPKAVYHWCPLEDGRVMLADDTVLGYEASLEFLLEQSDAPATQYVHKSMVAEGLATHLRRMRIPEDSI